MDKIVGGQASVKPRKRTLPPDERRRQIIDAVRRVVAEHGVPNTTVSRVAEAAGVAQGTLYLYFRNRTEMLLAALDSIWAEMQGVVEIPGETDELERLRRGGLKHNELMTTEQGSFAVPWVEFIAAPAGMGLRGAVAETQRRAFRKLREIVDREGQGQIRSDSRTDQLSGNVDDGLGGEHRLPGGIDRILRGEAVASPLRAHLRKGRAWLYQVSLPLTCSR